ncbi:hypothetical protein LVB77_15320 [Lysobacter sp. 5GHs7-4]|uniref:hypothetical protein n=1 Tax=Lysobacter sp. 5GHs7-4 TaxID=2904253 RepID=UPI001E51D98C|nr:hypothetical protein [Lysobacter sp. 5GHs7-4]UHQ22031.1 hypothetical protein LVB77_15320 [Lysobacter sp. 5GHs7-4]
MTAPDPRKPAPGYPEPQPRNPDDARQPHPQRPPNPDEGGLEREPRTDPDPADED